MCLQVKKTGIFKLVGQRHCADGGWVFMGDVGQDYRSAGCPRGLAHGALGQPSYHQHGALQQIYINPNSIKMAT